MWGFFLGFFFFSLLQTTVGSIRQGFQTAVRIFKVFMAYKETHQIQSIFKQLPVFDGSQKRPLNSPTKMSYSNVLPSTFSAFSDGELVVT